MTDKPLSPKPETVESKVRLATDGFTTSFTVPGVATVTAKGVELTASQVEKVRKAAESSGVALREIQ